MAKASFSLYPAAGAVCFGFLSDDEGRKRITLQKAYNGHSGCNRISTQCHSPDCVNRSGTVLDFLIDELTCEISSFRVEGRLLAVKIEGAFSP